MTPTRTLLVLLAALAAPSLLAADAAAIWKKQCAECHGKDGRGDTKTGRKRYISDLTNPELQAKFSDEQAAQSIKFGLKDAKGNVIMEPARRVSDKEVAELVAYVRSLKQ